MFQAFRTLIIVLALATPASAQEAGVRFGGLTQDTSLPVEVTSETLTVDQSDGSAVFTGNVLVKQGEMRMTATTIRVEYADGGQGVQRLHASGGVTLVSPTDAAEADDAVYSIESGTVVMTGNVLMTQGAAAISGNKLTVNLKDGTGTVTGNVKTIFSPGKKK